MKGEVKAALITGSCMILAAVIALIPTWKAGEKSGEQKAISNNQQIIEEKYNEGYKKGYEIGFDEGYNKGENAGYGTGFDEGYKKGKDEGLYISNEEIEANDDNKTVVFLGDGIKAYQRGGNDFEEYSIGDSESISISGIKYYQGIQATNYGGGSGWGIYNLQGKYSRLMGIVGHVDGYKMENGFIRFFGDGQMILEYELFADALGKDFSLDVTGIKQLKIDFDFGTSASYAIADARFQP